MAFHELSHGPVIFSQSLSDKCNFPWHTTSIYRDFIMKVLGQVASKTD